MPTPNAKSARLKLALDLVRRCMAAKEPSAITLAGSLSGNFKMTVLIDGCTHVMVLPPTEAYTAVEEAQINGPAR